MIIGYARVSTSEQDTSLQIDALNRIGCDIESRGIGFKSITESIDTTTAGGKLVFHLFAALSEFERALIQERTKAGLEAARARGRKGGRPKKLDASQIRKARAMLSDPMMTKSEVAKHFSVSRGTLQSALDSK